MFLLQQQPKEQIELKLLCNDDVLASALKRIKRNLQLTVGVMWFSNTSTR